MSIMLLAAFVSGLSVPELTYIERRALLMSAGEEESASEIYAIKACIGVPSII